MALSEEDLAENMRKQLDINKVFDLTEEQEEKSRKKSKTLIMAKINCEFKINKGRAKDIVQDMET